MDLETKECLLKYSRNIPAILKHFSPDVWKDRHASIQFFAIRMLQEVLEEESKSREPNWARVRAARDAIVSLKSDVIAPSLRELLSRYIAEEGGTPIPPEVLNEITLPDFIARYLLENYPWTPEKIHKLTLYVAVGQHLRSGDWYRLRQECEDAHDVDGKECRNMLALAQATYCGTNPLTLTFDEKGRAQLAARVPERKEEQVGDQDEQGVVSKRKPLGEKRNRERQIKRIRVSSLTDR